MSIIRKLSTIVIFSILLIGGSLLAGSLNPNVPVGSTSQVTLLDIYSKLANNNYSTSSRSFAPVSAPTSTSHTLLDIWNFIPSINPGNIISGNSILGIVGTYDISNLTPDKVASGTAYGLGLVGARTVCSDGYHNVNNICSNTYEHDMSTWNRTYSDGESLPGGIYFPTMAQSDYGHGYPLVFDNSGKIYAGYYRGYIYSTDGGQGWTIVDLSKKLPQSSSWAYVTVSPDGQRVWVSVPNLGIFSSNDAGNSFEQINQLTGINLTSIVNVLQSPYHPNHLIAFTSRDTGYGQRAGQIYRSIDSGNTWQSLNSAISSAGSVGPSGIDPIAFDPDSSDTFYFISMPSSNPAITLYVTTNGGSTFSSVSGSSMSYASAVGLSNDGNGKRLIISGACVYPKHTAISNISWSNVGGSDSNCGYDSTTTVHPLDLSNVYFWNKGGYSLDGGKTVQAPTIPISSPDGVFSRAFEEPFQIRTFYMVSNYGKLLKSIDGGANWSIVGAMPYSQ